jgi:hypothetical protein
MMKTLIAIGMVLTLVYGAQSCVAGISNNQPETISGTIRVVGNEPFTRVIIRPASRSGANAKKQDILITGPLAEELRKDFQGKAVTLEGNACTSPTSQFARCFKPTKIMVE